MDTTKIHVNRNEPERNMKKMKWERERNEEAGSENEGVVKIS